MAQVTGGQLKGLPLVVPRHIRVTEAKVRQALFNILKDVVEGARVIDAFAGSGALGLEALARGARDVYFLESHPSCVQAIRHNVVRAAARGFHGRCEILEADAVDSLRRLARAGETVDLVVADPPYEGAEGKKVLKALADCGILAPSGICCLEHPRQVDLPAYFGPLAVRSQHRYGDTVLAFFA